MSCTLKHCSQATGFEKKTGLGSAEAVAYIVVPNN